MNEKSDYIRLVQRAQLGDEKCLNRLAELARERLHVYVYRLTLADDLTQEIVQESMLEMCRILGKLKRADRFWPWLYGIAVNKLHRHHRTQRARAKLTKACAGWSGTPKARQEGLETLVSQELKQIVAGAMQKLRTRHRAVLVMRCYDGMSYAEIAESMGCSEFSTRMLFLRAKRSLQKQLSRNGFGKGSLLAALILFGKMTAPSEAVAANLSVTAATTKVGLLAGLVGAATSKTAIVSLTTAGVLTVGSMVVTSGPQKTEVGTSGESAGGSHIASLIGQAENDSEEYWYFFPEGPGKPMMMRLKVDTGGGQPYCQLLQNDQGNYHYQDDTIHINNYRMWSNDLGVFRVPTDSPELSEFLFELDPGAEPMQNVRSRGTGLLVIAARNRGQARNRSWAIRHYNLLDEDYFQADWPAGVKIVDNRDAMHKRGWTYFKVTGELDDRKVSGVGRVPFVYATSKQYGPWLRLAVGDDLRIADDGAAACIYGEGARLVASYEGGSFFGGLAQPWMGLHTIDCVRREAAEQRIRFETEHSPGSEKAKVELACEQVRLVYTIDLETDVIDEITFSKADRTRGYLRFSYLQEVDSAITEFAKPRVESSRGPRRKGNGPLWLAQLVEGSLGK
ncbi:MAG: RNA polymerase sigma factor [Phycisphaerales bacterium]|nr:MAG: RNA polymerase sigma factor [Phycisphaerales bacterium]